MMFDGLDEEVWWKEEQQMLKTTRKRQWHKTVVPTEIYEVLAAVYDPPGQRLGDDQLPDTEEHWEYFDGPKACRYNTDWICNKFGYSYNAYSRMCGEGGRFSHHPSNVGHFDTDLSSAIELIEYLLNRQAVDNELAS